MSLKDEFMKAAAPPHEDREVNGVMVRVRGLTAAQQMVLAGMDDSNDSDVAFWVVENSLCDPKDGSRLFKDGDPAVGEIAGELVVELAELAIAKSGLGETAKN